MFTAKYNNFLTEFNNGKAMVLSSCENNKVSSRMMSIVCINGMFYFQTDISFRKYRELIHNPQVALCIDNIQIEGVCKEIGHPMSNAEFCSEYKKHFNGSYKLYSSLKNERLFEVSPTFIERWLYIDGVPFIETFDVKHHTYKLTKYESDKSILNKEIL